MWPNNPEWSALENKTIEIDGNKYQLGTIDCGRLKLPSGKLVCCDPFAMMSKRGNDFVYVPVGEYKVVVTLADISEELDGSHMREAYATLMINEASTEITRKCLSPSSNGKATNKNLAPGEYSGFGVDAGTACFVDAQSLEEGMPDDDTWYEDLFENEKENCWFNLMDAPGHIREGIANITLPLSKNNNNLVLFHSGWGDGFYPVIGGYDENEQLVSIHIDFFVIPPPEQNDAQQKKSPWWKFW